MQKGEFTVDSLVDLIMDYYTGVTREVAQKDVESFIGVLKKNHILVPEPGEVEEIEGYVRVKVKE